MKFYRERAWQGKRACHGGQWFAGEEGDLSAEAGGSKRWRELWAEGRLRQNVQGAAGGPCGWSRHGRGQGMSYRPGRSWRGSPFCSELGGGWEHRHHREMIVAGPMRGGSGQSPHGAGVRGGTSICCDRQSKGKYHKLSGLQNAFFHGPTEVLAKAPS